MKKGELEKSTIVRCIEIATQKTDWYYEEAKKAGSTDPSRERELATASLAIRELINELWELHSQA